MFSPIVRIANIKANNKNLFANYLNFVSLAILNFLISPQLLYLLGPASFGLWKAGLRYLEFASTADGRASQALKWIVAFQSSSDDIEAKRRSVGAAILIWMLCLPILVVTLAIIIYAIPYTINNISSTESALLRVVCLILAANVLVSALLGIPDAVLTGSNQGYRSMIVNTVIMIVVNGFFLFVASSGFGIIAMATVSLSGTLLNGLIAWSIVRKYVNWWGVARPLVSDIKRVWNFTGWTMIWSFVQLLMLSAEFLLIGYIFGPKTVAAYSFTAFPTQFALAMCLLTTSAAAPALGALLGRGDFVAVSASVRRMREAVLGLATLFGSGILVLNESFVTLWAGTTSYMGATVNVFMVVSFLQLAMIRCEAQLQDVSLEIRQKAAHGAVGSVVSIFLGWICYKLVPQPPSIFIGVIVGRIGISIVYPMIVTRGLKAEMYPVQQLVAVVIIFMVAGITGWFVSFNNWLHFLIASILVTAIAAPATLLLVLSKEARDVILSRLSAAWASHSRNNR